jgi:UDP-glucose 4-epimerase
MRGKRVIVTGGLGFIGSNLVEKLIENNEVIIIDNQSTGTIDNIRDVANDDLTVIIGSINDLNLAEIFMGCDYVFHQAALPSVPRSIEDPLGTNDTNVSGTVRVLTSAKDTGIKKVVYASSSSIYGDTPTLPKREDMPVNPLSPYAVAKLAGELYCKVFCEIYGLSTISLRYFNVFGPRQDTRSPYAAVIPKFIKAIMSGCPPVVYGDGEQSRDFTFVRHVVDANISACESNKTGVFNIACGRQVTINHLVEMIDELLNKDIIPVYADPRPGEIRHSLANIHKAGSFGYAPKTDFKEELKETIRWFGDRLSG